jgi:hypothetical protein
LFLQSAPVVRVGGDVILVAAAAGYSRAFLGFPFRLPSVITADSLTSAQRWKDFVLVFVSW